MCAGQVATGDVDSVRAMLASKKVAITSENHRGETCLHLAAREGNVTAWIPLYAASPAHVHQILQLLLGAVQDERRRAHMVSISSFAGFTAQHYATSHGHSDCAAILQAAVKQGLPCGSW